MSLADATIPRLDVVGPPGLKHYMAAMRSYTYRWVVLPVSQSVFSRIYFRNGMPVLPSETPSSLENTSTPQPVYKDENITVYSIPVYPSISDAANQSDAAATENGKRKHSGEMGDQPPGKRPHTTVGSGTVNSEEEAQALRGLMIDTMFPASSKARETAPQKNKPRGKRQNNQSVKETKEPQGGKSTNVSHVFGVIDALFFSFQID